MKRILLTLAVVCYSGLAVAQGPACGPRTDLVRHLAEQFHESPLLTGIDERGTALLEIFSSPGGETWTIVITRPDGISCLAATGIHLQPASQEDAKPLGRGS